MSTVRDELIQVAAVAIAIVTDLDQRSTDLFLDRDAHNKVMKDVFKERVGQENKWGAQHHDIYKWLAILGEEVGEANQAALEEEY